MSEKATTFGAFFKEQRKALGLTLREFCHQKGFDAGNLSRLERGLSPPPQQREKLAAYAEALGLNDGSDEWYELFDLAAAEKGRIPEDLQTDDIMEKLPVLFRTLRGQEVPEHELDALVELMKGKRSR